VIPGNVRPCVKDPNLLGRQTFLEEDDVAFTPWLYGRECTPGQTEHCMEIALLNEDLKDLARLSLEETVVWQHNRRPSPGLSVFITC